MACATVAPPLTAQTPEGVATASLRPTLGAVRLAGETRAIWGGFAQVHLGGRWSLGGGGVTLANRVGIQQLGGDARLGLGFGYGGVTVHRLVTLLGGGTISAGILLGAGSASLRDSVLGIEIGVQNFLVAEPQVGVFYRGDRALGLGASMAYRFVSRVKDLEPVKAADIDGLRSSIFLTLRRP